MDHTITIKLFEHCRLIVGMVISLAVARLLNGLARFVQHPKKVKVYPTHIGWVFAILLMLLHFWWWEFKLINVTQWTFEAYTLVVLYAVVFLLLSSLLFPDQMDEYSGFEDYFVSRRKWFFGIFALSFVIDLADTALKGMTYFHSLGIEYPIRNAVYISFCIAAMFVKNKYFQIGFVLLSLIYQLSYIFRLYHTQ
ncbi:MAG: hypothetical protein K2X77_27205 [Candidatus Obscuribacterales bacterium]|jgi:hypothetical protein|nr:hypothetical protein [Candidatus Obscuribacterales bacterium]